MSTCNRAHQRDDDDSKPILRSDLAKLEAKWKMELKAELKAEIVAKLQEGQKETQRPSISESTLPVSSTTESVDPLAVEELVEAKEPARALAQTESSRLASALLPNVPSPDAVADSPVAECSGGQMDHIGMISRVHALGRGFKILNCLMRVFFSRFGHLYVSFYFTAAYTRHRT